MFNSLSLKQKILAGGLFPLILVGIVNLIGLINFNGVVESYDQVEHTYQVTEMGSDIEKAAFNMEAGERGYLLTGNESYLEPYIEGSQKYQELFKELKQMTKDKEALDALAEGEKELDHWKAVIDPHIQKRRDLARSPDVNNIMSALVGQRQGKEHFDAFRVQMKLFDTKEKALLESRITDADNVTHMTNNVIVFGTAISLFLAVMIAVYIVKIIITPITIIRDAAMRISKGETEVAIDVESRDELGEMAKVFKVMIESLNNFSVIAHKIGQGDLNVTVLKRSENDILGKALENMLINLNTIMMELKESVFALNSAASEILATTSQVSSSASQTFSAVAQTSASVEEIKQTAKVSSAKAVQTAESTTRAMEIAKSGTEGLNENMKGLNQIKEKMDLIASNIIQLSDQSQQIGEITGTVEDIANQANMLAVNASIEAVKAGEQGKGFSVVALELKNLAEQSKQGMKQVQKILFDIQKVTATLVMVAEQGSKAVENGVVQAQNAKISMDQLNASVFNAANAGKQIAASYEQELAGMDQISGAMSSIKEATAQNLSSTKQVELSARDLSALSQKLKEVMDHYTIADTK
ncbi:MAG: methyl-accepting chemotaxis protein [Sulfuricurvum sp.]|jgi:methyl-accepting chemotaxis protein|uniref:methyl-accepting chemotaxis protein n=1 Tax=Sulfuricurvum sp. TaxID=2025608 RepID=UPI0025F4218B|nr:methyl-accepting chemotaxis protein [Sulfuricurvum sp.]MCK9373545.1 methyl-accepting chemotaxis protein [Sulfuricurvum sp.]